MAAGPERTLPIGAFAGEQNTAAVFLTKNHRREAPAALCVDIVDYYGGATATVPFLWETTPGTPKCAAVCSSPPPPPPPSHLIPPPIHLPERATTAAVAAVTGGGLEVCHRRNRRLLASIFGAFSASGKNEGASSSPSTSSSSSSLSYSEAIGDIMRRSRSAHRSEWSAAAAEEGGRKWRDSVVLRSRSSSKGMKKALYSLVGHGYGNGKQ